MSELVERLRAWADDAGWTTEMVTTTLTEAADDLVDARAERDALRARIDAALALLSWATDNDGCYCGGDRQRVCTLHLRAALTGEPDHDQP